MLSCMNYNGSDISHGTVATFKASNSTVSDNREDKRKLQTWNKSYDSCSTIFSLNDKTEGVKKDWKKSDSLKSTKNSTLSLHICAYENSTEATVSDDSFNENNKRILIKGKSIFDSTIVIQNPFSFPRQQNGEGSEPELSQFKAAQRLRNPNQANMNPRHQLPLLQPMRYVRLPVESGHSVRLTNQQIPRVLIPPRPIRFIQQIPRVLIPPRPVRFIEQRPVICSPVLGSSIQQRPIVYLSGAEPSPKRMRCSSGVKSVIHNVSPMATALSPTVLQKTPTSSRPKKRLPQQEAIPPPLLTVDDTENQVLLEAEEEESRTVESCLRKIKAVEKKLTAENAKLREGLNLANQRIEDTNQLLATNMEQLEVLQNQIKKRRKDVIVEQTFNWKSDIENVDVKIKLLNNIFTLPLRDYLTSGMAGSKLDTVLRSMAVLMFENIITQMGYRLSNFSVSDKPKKGRITIPLHLFDDLVEKVLESSVGEVDLELKNALLTKIIFALNDKINRCRLEPIDQLKMCGQEFMEPAEDDWLWEEPQQIFDETIPESVEADIVSESAETDLI